LEKQHDQAFNPGAGIRVEAVTSAPGKVMKSPFTFKQHGSAAGGQQRLSPSGRLRR